jgi:hypothetical protein
LTDALGCALERDTLTLGQDARTHTGACLRLCWCLLGGFGGLGGLQGGLNLGLRPTDRLLLGQALGHEAGGERLNLICHTMFSERGWLIDARYARMFWNALE